ncbi:protein-L-isoaspartate O-methyltransferase family protein [Streptomyces asiaticus]|uniref:protein-L-isoaspartate O-methyltransferase family protein n=1 Tax=Streptomyces asiaticus TaxID=114695 RepID=UPI0038060134
MLDSLLLEPGHRVLELGAGTGWNAALLTWRTGPGRVVSVEVDDELARQAKQHLDAAGTDAAVVTADGAGGRKDRSCWGVPRSAVLWRPPLGPGLGESTVRGGVCGLRTNRANEVSRRSCAASRLA